MDRGYFEAFHAIKAHYQVDVRRESSVPRNLCQHDGRGYVVHVSGSNARVNINSQDYSNNIITEVRDPLFEDTISTQINDIEQKQKFLNCVELEKSKGTSSFTDKYKSFMTIAVDHTMAAIKQAFSSNATAIGYRADCQALILRLSHKKINKKIIAIKVNIFLL